MCDLDFSEYSEFFDTEIFTNDKKKYIFSSSLLVLAGESFPDILRANSGRTEDQKKYSIIINYDSDLVADMLRYAFYHNSEYLESMIKTRWKDALKMLNEYKIREITTIKFQNILYETFASAKSAKSRITITNDLSQYNYCVTDGLIKRIAGEICKNKFISELSPDFLKRLCGCDPGFHCLAILDIWLPKNKKNIREILYSLDKYRETAHNPGGIFYVIYDLVSVSF